MKHHKEIIEALIAGCHPTTGEMLGENEVIQLPEVRAALETILSAIRKTTEVTSSQMPFEEVDLKTTLAEFINEEVNPTPARLAGFLLGIRNFKTNTLSSHPLFGKYAGLIGKGAAEDCVKIWIDSIRPPYQKRHEDQPWLELTFFHPPTYNQLGQKAIDQLKEKIAALPMLKTENLSPHIFLTRKIHSRAYEPWTADEYRLLAKAIEYTNDSALLAKCFGRTQNSIESAGLKILWEKSEQKVNAPDA